ncbi:hypothetical protein K443DRAFT_377323 [Laccaria amethystina LaAM-08-1]|uniref:Unplaced genomic scaffold K443scaffold_286, whole genome shotgun sequence n=1 Tax=Laccaria amethystina LaAM-08-1 TaxID=1095629 RepID=A0A0C9WY35_9AGAR|nr:hypothetical protein K443DRAFT_377323 [Laccaria amethystina LaAM-08-1]
MLGHQLNSSRARSSILMLFIYLSTPASRANIIKPMKPGNSRISALPLLRGTRVRYVEVLTICSNTPFVRQSFHRWLVHMGLRNGM